MDAREPSISGRNTDARRFFSIEQDIEKRGNHFPHWQQGSVWCFVTWRLQDSVPKTLYDSWNAERMMWLRQHPEPRDELTESEYRRRFSRRLEEWLDQGHGDRLLRQPEMARCVSRVLHHFNEVRYELAAFAIMPSHLHILFRTIGDHTIFDLVRNWKGCSSREMNLLRGRKGPVWQAGYWDVLVRSPEHFGKIKAYILRNPEKAGLGVGEYLLYST